ncbi:MULTISPECIES: O-methyltransferase [Methylobacterium]|uniref:Catechol O-methyltransferase n=1 Tax=Methylobacterium isbiliense TaxID=315478 RepID=A0ABQ4SGJ2_9HYPH|nr:MULTISPECIES: O-methyltransferase [Methylobacterium]MBY0296086.1 O-methyltransferase [Methylobacterium sp.]MDN3622354.1 O-methyltransferase [Methylobacterium isbiliense]GJE01615.1 Catechol O-methyltransferase [Methylobacterium isbiliense]
MTVDPRWEEVDRYLVDRLIPPDAARDGALAASGSAGLPPIAVAPTHGKLLMLLAQGMGARRILEIGTLGGYSTLWLARALPAGGRLVTIEADPRHAAVARGSFARAGLAGIIDLREGRALDVLPTLRGEGPFDFVFIDADKPSNPDYVAHALTLARPGTLIVLDNVVRRGAVTDPAGDEAVQGVRRALDLVAAEPRLDATVIQTVGEKGWDGFALIRVVG